MKKSYFNNEDHDYHEIEPFNYTRRKLKFGTVLLGFGAFAIGGLVLVLLVSNHNAKNNFILMQRVDDSNSSNLVVSVKEGQIVGKTFISRQGRNYYGFLGVPFAKPPIGPLRFSPPQNPESWTGIRDCTKFQSQCMQLRHDDSGTKYVALGSEDCLYANVFTPRIIKESLNKRFPVAVYIHGGIENGNGSQYGADYMMDEDIVLVFLQFRLHVFANLNTGDEAARGNFGVKDVVKALEWIRANVDSFNGDPSKVMLFGNSSGAMLISIVVLAPMSRGLFHRTIQQSGTILFHGKFTRDPETPLQELAKEVDCPMNVSSIDLVNCLRNIDARRLAILAGDITFMNSVEPKSQHPEVDTCLEDEPLKLVTAKKFNPVTSIYGVNAAEDAPLSLGLLFSKNITNYLNENWDEVVGDVLDFDNASDPSNITSILKEFYIGKGNVTRANLKNLTDMFSDRDWIHPTKIEAEYQLMAQSQNPSGDSVYLYYFTQDVPKSLCDSKLLESFEPDEKFDPPCHADEYQFLFPMKKVPRIDTNSEYFNFSRIMVNIWFNFANSGIPYCSLPEFDLQPWTKLENENYEMHPYLWYNLSIDPSMIDPVSHRMKLWDKFSLEDLYI